MSGLALCSTLSAQIPRPPHLYQSDATIANTQTARNQGRPAVAVGPDGNYLIVWQGDALQQFFIDIQGQLFSHDGVKIGNEFQVDQAPAGRILFTPEIAVDGAGNYIVVWADFNQTVNDSEVWMRRFDGGANPLGNAVQVNTFTTGFQRLPQVAAAPNGKFVVVWESVGQDGDGLGIFGQRFDASGNPSGTEFSVNLATTGDQDRASLDMDDAGFTVAYNDGASGVAAREFGAFAQVGGPITVFGPNHRNAAVSRLQGTSNTLYVAENTSTGSLDGIRTEAGALQPQFVFAQATNVSFLNPRLKAFDPPTSTPTEQGASRDSPSGLSLPRGFATWDELDDFEDEYEALLYEFGIDTAGPVFRIGQVIRILPADPLLRVTRLGVGAGQVVVAGQANNALDGDGTGVQQARAGRPHPIALAMFDDNADGVLDPNESVHFSAAVSVLGPLPPVPASYDGGIAPPTALRAAPQTLTITDATADYGTIPPGGTADCQATGDCYGILVSGTRPGLHWDEAVTETLNADVHKTWLLHVGESFADVPATNPFYAFIENLLHNGITAGGACGGYCPTDGVKRQQMAVFLLKSRFGATVTPPPATGTVFADVPITNPFAAWIELLYLLGITGGCQANPLLYCPDAIVNRQQMAVFLLKMKEGSSYDPPDCAGIFTDVPCTPGAGFSDWIEELYNRQITGGCVANPLQYCPTNPTNRQQMAVFLVKTFGLLLYGP